MGDAKPGGHALQFRPNAARQALSDAITRISQKACRNGEAGSREWPELRQLPLLESWRCIGEDYADAVMAEMLTAAMAELNGGVEPK